MYNHIQPWKLECYEADLTPGGKDLKCDLPSNSPVLLCVRTVDFNVWGRVFSRNIVIYWKSLPWKKKVFALDILSFYTEHGGNWLGAVHIIFTTASLNVHCAVSSDTHTLLHVHMKFRSLEFPRLAISCLLKAKDRVTKSREKSLRVAFWND